jgi:hypothetical protein
MELSGGGEIAVGLMGPLLVIEPGRLRLGCGRMLLGAEMGLRYPSGWDGMRLCTGGPVLTAGSGKSLGFELRTFIPTRLLSSFELRTM